MRRTIQYAIDPETGLTVSRVGSEIVFYVLDYPRPTIHKEKANILELAGTSWLDSLIWTRKISKQAKNSHRKFWGFKLL